MDRDEHVYNDTFGRGPCTDLNACVGNNGSQDHSIYAQGYLKAAQLLLEPLVQARSVVNVDAVVFPVAFCIRHGLELHLKLALSELTRVRSSVIVDLDKLSKTHDIGLLWSEFETKARSTDSRYAPLLDQLGSHVSDYAEMDLTGQTFRYPQNHESQKHLIKTPLINLERLLIRLLQLTPLINELEYLNEALIDEYAQGTFTKTLSRADIGKIANYLPNWRDRHLAEFKEARAQLLDEMGIGGRPFNEALELIKKHPLFGVCMGIEQPLQYLRTQELAFFMQCLDEQARPPYSGSLFEGNVNDVDEMISEMMDTADLTKACIDRISLPSRAEISALYYFGREGRYCEEYERSLMREIQDAHRSEPFQYIHHVLVKTNARQCIEKALELMGQYRLLVNMDHMRTDF